MTAINTLYFLSPDTIPNYKDDATMYTNGTMIGKYCAVAYPYYILCNRGYKNISLIKNGNEAPEDAPIYFHYDNRNQINLQRNRGIQFVNDRPAVPGCEAYICCNRFLINPFYNMQLIDLYGVDAYACSWVYKNWFYVPHPFPVDIKTCTPQWPPKIFSFNGRPHTLISEITTDKFVKEMQYEGISLRFNCSDNNMGEEHVTFCIRDHSHISPTGGNNVDTRYGHRHAGRLFQTWLMNIPGIFELNSAMLSYRQSDTDFLIANTASEFKKACLLLRDNEKLYYSMVETCKRRAGTGSNDDFVEYLKTGLNKYGIQLYD